MKRFIALLSALIICAFGCFSASAETYPEYMETEEYNVSVIVSEDNTLSVTEKITVNFNTERHGIYRYIPYILELDRVVGDERIKKRMRADITDVIVSGDDYTVENDGVYELIIIGDEDRYVFGEKTYTISYKMKIYDDGIAAADFVYFNLLPTEWETDIEKFEARIEFAKPMTDDTQINILSGKYGETDNGTISYAVSDRMDAIVVWANGPLALGETVTTDIVLPEGYFQGEATTDWAVPLALIAAGVIATITVLLYLFFGRDTKPIPVVNFYPPNNLSSAEIGHIIDGFTDQKDLISLIIYWAHKGYLDIEQNGKDFTFIKKSSLPRGAKSFEAVMFNGLFASGDVVTMASLKNKFYVTMERATADINRYFSAIPENRIYTRSSTVARIVSWLLCGLPLALVSMACLFVSAASSDALVIVPIIEWVAAAALCAFNIGLWDKQHADTKGKFAGKVLALGIVTAVLALAAAMGVALFSRMWLPMFLGAAATLLAIAFAVPTNKRTKENTRLLGEILGFKQFIEHAELDRLKALVEQDPQYFYNVIPFAYVLGLSDKWAKKFETIAIEPPTWYRGYDYPFSSWMFWHSFNNSMDRCRANMVSVPQQSKGSGVGGFGGGGGFSGGGFGGGGGGSW